MPLGARLVYQGERTMAVTVYACWDEPPEVVEQEWRAETLPALRVMAADAIRVALIALPLALLLVYMLGPHNLPSLMNAAGRLIAAVALVCLLPISVGLLSRPRLNVGRRCRIDERGWAHGDYRVLWRHVRAYTIEDDPQRPGVGVLSVQTRWHPQGVSLRFWQRDLEALELLHLLKRLVPEAEHPAA